MPTCPENGEKCPYVSESAEAAVKKVFAILGVNVDIPKEVEAFREDLRFGGSLRRAAEKGMLAMVVITAGAIVYAIWAGVIAALTGNK